MDNNNERWKSDGDCSKCRRKKYCTKACGANVKRLQILVTRTIDDRLGGAFFKTIYSIRK